MIKQKICIIGGSLAGLVTAISLSKLNCEIDLIIGKDKKNPKSNITTAISENNFNFLNRLNISESIKKDAWSCSVMKLYTEDQNDKFSKIFELDNNKEKNKILYMLKNSKITEQMVRKVKKIKSISVIKHKKISEIRNSGLLKSIKLNNLNHNYNLIIICAGNNSDLVKNIFSNHTIENSYKEISITTILKHDSIKNNIARQIFLDEGIFAMLPISNIKTSVVWSIKKNKKKDTLFLKNKIKFYAKNYLKNISFIANIESRNLNFLIREKYYKERILLFGDALHVIHPFVGQGFNMILRDLLCLEKILSKKISLGLDIGSSDILSEFSNEVKPRNFAFSIGVDFLKNSFSFKQLRNTSLKILNKNNLIKNIFFNIANKGFRF